MFKRILVPLDGSALAEQAIYHAEQFARIFGSKIILLQVLDPAFFHENPISVDPLNWQIRKKKAEIYLEEVTKRMNADFLEDPMPSVDFEFRETESPKSRVEYAISEGKAAESIVNFAHQENIDLLIISTHGAGGLSRWNISSITQKVIDMIYLPILLIRSYYQPKLVVNRVHYRRILLPVDSSRRAECALSVGLALARGEIPEGFASELNSRKPIQTAKTIPSLPTQLVLIAVIKPPEIPIPEPYPPEIEQLTKKLMTVSRRVVSEYLEETKARLQVDCETYVLESSSVSSAIQNFANQEENIDLVVLCAHGYTGQIEWPYGSIARNYIEYGTKPVLIIQDVPRSEFQPTAAEIASKKVGGR